MMKKIQIAAVGAAALLGSLSVRAERPNVVMIVTDDQDFSTIGAFGGKVLTPNIDRLVQSGIRLDRFYVPTSICTPSRYTLLTGRYPSQCMHEDFLIDHPTREIQAFPDFRVHIEADRPGLPKTLQAGGYVTGLVGKWHLSGEIPEMNLWRQMGLHKLWSNVDLLDPAVNRQMQENYAKCVAAVKQHGFDYVDALYWSNWYGFTPDGVQVIMNNQEWVSAKAIEFLEINREKPFFLMINSTLDHKPNQNPALRLDPRITPAGLLDDVPQSGMPPRDTILPRLDAAGIDPYMARLTYLDDGVGAVLDKLDELGLRENTLIIYMADNGIDLKATCYEGGCHVPAAVRWPAGLPQGVENEDLISSIDLPPTILDACGLTAPEEMDARGTSLLPLLRGKTEQWKDALYLEIGNTRAVVTDRWKYIAFRVREPWLSPPRHQWPKGHGGTPGLMKKHGMALQPAYWDADQLYDLHNDPDEQRNLAGNPEVAPVLKAMKARLSEFCSQFERPFAEFSANKIKDADE